MNQPDQPRQIPDSPSAKLREAGFTNPDDDEEEDELWEGGYSANAMPGPGIMLAGASLLVLFAMLFVSALRSNGTIWMVVVAVLILVWLFFVGTFVYRRLGVWYELTTQRFKHREGILVRKSDRVELIDIDDVNYRQGPIEAMLGIGTINIRSSDATHPELIIRGISSVQKVADLIDDARRKERRKRGLHIESI